MPAKAQLALNITKVAVLVTCLALCLLQSRAEILLYLQHRIYTATSIDQVDQARDSSGISKQK